MVSTRFVVDDSVFEFDILNRDPLIVAEVTASIRSREEATNEIEKLILRRDATESIFKLTAEMVILSVTNVEEAALEFLKDAAEREAITLLFGREIKS